MKHAFRKPIWTSRGVAAVEFALIAPLFVLMITGVVDFALAFWTKGLLASSVAEGAAYAFVVGPGVSTSNIKNVVARKLSLPMSAINVTGLGCYCLSGTPATAASQTCGNPCPDGSTPGTFVTITAQYTYQSLFVYSQLNSPMLTETTVARIK